MEIHACDENGPVITGVDDWLQLAPPAGRARQWQDFRSAKELASEWFRSGHAQAPEELLALLSGSRATAGFAVDRAVAEMKIPLDGFAGNTRNSDLVAFGNSKAGAVVAAVEAKADEPFGQRSIGEELDACRNPRSNLPARIAQLSQAVFGRAVDAAIRPLRYQLLHALAATAIVASEYQAKVGVLVIHEFISLGLDFDRVVENANDLQAFVAAVPGWEQAEYKTGRLLPPIMLTGGGLVPANQAVTIGKIRTLLPPRGAT